MNEAEQTVDRDGFGLDKIARLEAKRAAEIEEELPEPLDPPFPYRVMPFDAVVASGSGT